MSLHEEAILRSFCSKKEQLKGMVGRCSGIGMHGLDITRDVVETGMQRQIDRGERSDEGDRGCVNLIRDLFHRIASEKSPAVRVFHQRGECDPCFFGKLSHRHTVSLPNLF